MLDLPPQFMKRVSSRLRRKRTYFLFVWGLRRLSPLSFKVCVIDKKRTYYYRKSHLILPLQRCEVHVGRMSSSHWLYKRYFYQWPLSPKGFKTLSLVLLVDFSIIAMCVCFTSTCGFTVNLQSKRRSPHNTISSIFIPETSNDKITDTLEPL